MRAGLLPDRQHDHGGVSFQPNAPLVAAIEAAKAARLPQHIEAQIARVGVKPERPEPRRPYVAWKPTPDDPTPPF